MNISGRQPYVSVDLRQYEIWLCISEDIPECRGLFEKIKAVLLRCQGQFDWFFYNNILIVSALVCTFAGIVGSFLSHFTFMLAFSAALFIISLFWGIYKDWYLVNRYTIIVPKYRIDSPSFVKRNGDKIILAMISALIGAVIGAISTHFLK
jgi:hypothetical protein